MQITSEKDIAKRSRFYHSLINLNILDNETITLKSGLSLEEVKNLRVVKRQKN